MFTLLHFFKSFAEMFRPQRDRDESYLEQSVDLCDLERRIRALEERGRDPCSGIAVGLYAR